MPEILQNEAGSRHTSLLSGRYPLPHQTLEYPIHQDEGLHRVLYILRMYPLEQYQG